MAAASTSPPSSRCGIKCAFMGRLIAPLAHSPSPITPSPSTLSRLPMRRQRLRRLPSRVSARLVSVAVVTLELPAPSPAKTQRHTSQRSRLVDAGTGLKCIMSTPVVNVMRLNMLIPARRTPYTSLWNRPSSTHGCQCSHLPRVSGPPLLTLMCPTALMC